MHWTTDVGVMAEDGVRFVRIVEPPDLITVKTIKHRWNGTRVFLGVAEHDFASGMERLMQCCADVGIHPGYLFYLHAAKFATLVFIALVEATQPNDIISVFVVFEGWRPVPRGIGFGAKQIPLCAMQQFEFAVPVPDHSV